MQQIGIDGWPVDPKPGPSVEQAYERVREWRNAQYRIKELLRTERAWRDKRSVPALAVAVELCRRDLPAWVADGVQEMLATLISTPDYDMHYTRWDLVSELRDRRDELKIPRRLPDGTMMGAGYEPTLEAAYENAAEKLVGTAYEGFPDTIKKSYQLIQRLFRSGKRLYVIHRGKI